MSARWTFVLVGGPNDGLTGSLDFGPLGSLVTPEGERYERTLLEGTIAGGRATYTYVDETTNLVGPSKATVMTREEYEARIHCTDRDEVDGSGYARGSRASRGGPVPSRT